MDGLKLNYQECPRNKVISNGFSIPLFWRFENRDWNKRVLWRLLHLL